MCAHVNIRSLLNKVRDLEEYILLYKIDVLAVSETWLSGLIPDNDVRIQGFVCVRSDRAGRVGGSVLREI